MTTITISHTNQFAQHTYALRNDITSIIISDTMVPENAFYACNNIETIEVKPGAILNDFAFTNCMNIGRLIILPGATVMRGAFRDCSIRSITIWNQSRLDNNAFKFCKISIIECLQGSSIKSAFDLCNAQILIVKPMSYFVWDDSLRISCIEAFDRARWHQLFEYSCHQVRQAIWRKLSLGQTSDIPYTMSLADMYRDYFINRIRLLANKQISINLCGKFPSLAAMCVKTLTSGHMRALFPELPSELGSDRVRHDEEIFKSPNEYLFSTEFTPFYYKRINH